MPVTHFVNLYRDPMDEPEEHCKYPSLTMLFRIGFEMMRERPEGSTLKWRRE
jgi:hypothetical protein